MWTADETPRADVTVMELEGGNESVVVVKHFGGSGEYVSVPRSVVRESRDCEMVGDECRLLAEGDRTVIGVGVEEWGSVTVSAVDAEGERNDVELGAE